MLKRWFAVALVLALCGGVGVYPAFAGGPCSTCSGEPNFPNAVAFLNAHGYAAQDYQVLLTWSEQVPDDSGKFVTGFHVRPVSGGAAFDLYSDGAGNLLSDAQVAQLGITQKRWNLPPAEAEGGIPASVAKMAPARPVAVGPKNGLAPQGAVVLPPVDVQKALAEDAARAASGAKGGRRISVFQRLDKAVSVAGAKASYGTWQAVPTGGALWSVSIDSPGALGIRVHFATISLPKGAQVVVYNTNNPVEALGPYTGPAKGMPDLWSATSFSDSVVVECFAPAGVDANNVQIVVDKITHQYVPFGDVAWGKGILAKAAAGTCENDVTCYPTWAATATGIAGYTGISLEGGFFCSGTLLADTTATGTPYFLTANHCVSTATTAATLEFYWLYQTSSCNGTPPTMSSVPSTAGGAALLATTDVTTGTDFCLLRLNTLPPAGVSYVGWSSAATPLGTSTVCIHHPNADYKRISFGSVTSDNPSLPSARFYQNTWTSGVTEPGSSGSPLLLVSSQKVIGQLYGGPSACGVAATDMLDYFGRFDQTYPLVQSYLNPAINPPTAQFTASPLSGETPLTVQFTDQSSAGGAPITSWSWDFGDGGTSTDQNPTYVYNASGTYTVSLKVTNTNGSNSATRVNYISVRRAGSPTAQFSATPISGQNPLLVQFTDESNPGGAAITSWSWDFGDGSTSTAQNPSHTYTVAGSYTVSLTVTNSIDQNTATKEHYITVISPTPPTAAFVASPVSGPSPLAVQFTDQSSPGAFAITQWAWDFGDGATSSSQNPSHTYTATGSYTVRLMVTSSAGSNAVVKQNYITVLVSGWTGAKTLQMTVKEEVMPPPTGTPIDPVSPLAVRVTGADPIAGQTVTIQAQSGDSALSGTVSWRPTDALDGRDGWAIFTPSETMPAGTVTVTVSAATVKGESVGPLVEQFDVGTATSGGPIAAGLVEDTTISPLPQLLAAPQSKVYRIIPTGVFTEPLTVQLPVSSASEAQALAIYYYSESERHPGWYTGTNVVGWIVPGSRRTVVDNGQTYLEFQVNHSGVLQLGKSLKLYLGSVGAVGVSASGSWWQWALAGCVLLSLLITLVRKPLRKS